jgi:signal transduction histidine kinase
MKATLRRWLQPSLVRRLVLAQMGMAALLWLALAGWATVELRSQASEDDLEQMRLGASVVLQIAAALESQPEQLRQSLQRIDTFQRSAVAPDSALHALQLPRLYLWRNGQLVYQSRDAQADFKLETTGDMVNVVVNGLPWLGYAEDSLDKQWRFAAVTPASAEAFGLSPWSRAWLVTPLLISLPLLLVPAWWSVRLALRPWARVSSEIASRGPDDLSPLRFAPSHRELSPLTRAVNQLLERLRSSRERERSFIADAAHELRTPIAAMQVNAEALQVRHIAPEDRELLEGMLKSNARAGRLVVQLLSLTRTDTSSSLRLSAVVDLEALVQDSLAPLAAMAQAKRIELDLESQPGSFVQGDEESLRMLIDNLVGNAIKYSPVGSVVRVRVHNEPGAVQLLVLDEGPGIAPEFRARVLDRFYRVPGQDQPGSGLGLAIAKSVADRHGASLELVDGPDAQGLMVRVRLATGAPYMADDGSKGRLKGQPNG